MGVSDYVRGLREKIGHDYLLVPVAGAVIRDDDGRILLVRHVEGQWQLPGGAIDPDETPEEAMRRECREEASIEVRSLGIVGAYGGPDFRNTYANGDEVGAVAILFAAEIADGTPAPGDDETQDVGWFTADEIDMLNLRRSSRAGLSALLSLDPPICAGGAPVWARQAASRPGSGPYGAWTRPVRSGPVPRHPGHWPVRRVPVPS